MSSKFELMKGAEGWQLSNPPILAMASMKQSLSIFQEAGMQNLRKKSIHMNSLLTSLLVEWDHPSISVITPQNIDENGCQLSIRLRQPDKSIFVALTNQGIIADWREPDVIRIAPVPLYNNFEELITFFNKFKQIVENYG